MRLLKDIHCVRYEGSSDLLIQNDQHATGAPVLM